MAISARDRITRLTIYANESDMIDDINGTDYTDGVVDGTQRFEHIKFNSLPGFGEANAAMYKCEISGTTDLTGKWIRVRYCFYDTDSATTRTVEAVFAGKVDSCKYDRYHISRSLVAYDKIYDLRNIDISDWWSNYWSTANDSTAFEVFDAMCTSFGVFHMLTSSDFRNNFTILKDAQKGRKLGGCSFADFLKYVGQINGFYWEVLPSGMLTCTAPTASYPQSFDTYTDFKETTIEDADAEAYGTFTVYDGADIIYTSGTGEPTYTFANNILLYGHTTASLVSILDITKNYLVWFVGTRPATVEVIYSQIPERQAISVTDNGTPRTCVISKNEMWGAQLINQRLTCTGNRIIGTQYSSALNRAANEIQKIGTELTYKVNADNVIEAVNLEAQGGVTINAEAININGVISANNGFKVNLDGSVESTVGKIGGWIIDGEMLYKDVTISGTVYRVMLNAPTSPSLTTPAVVVRKRASGGSTWTDVSSILYSGKVISKDFEANGKVVIRPDASSQGTDKAINIIDGQLGTSLQGGLNVYYYNPTTNKTSYGRFASGTLFLGQADGDFRESNTPPDPSTADTIIGRFRLDVDGKDILRTHQSLVGGYGTAIPSGADLNSLTYLAVGRYYVGTDAVAASLSNCPVAYAFCMEVYAPISSTIDNESTGTYVYRIQRITRFDGVEYTRKASSGSTAGVFTFEPWYRKQDSRVSEENASYWMKTQGSRPTSLDFTHIYDDSRGHMRLDLSTSSLSGGANSVFGEGYVQTFMWDTSGKWDTQFYLPDADGNPPAYRTYNASISQWSAVKRFDTSQSGTTTVNGITWTWKKYDDGYVDMYADITLNGTWTAWGGMYVLEPTATYALPITVTKKLADVTTYRYTDGNADSALPTTYTPTSNENQTTCALLRPTVGNNNTNYYCRKYIRAKI